MVRNELENKKKYHLVSWQNVCLPKDCGGLGVLDLETMNISLLCKWLWKHENTDGTWQEMLRKKYLQKQTLAQAASGPGCSHFWQGLMKVNHTFQQFACKIMNDGKRTLFWEDTWVNNSPLKEQFPRLFNIYFSQKSDCVDGERKWLGLSQV